MEQNEPSTGEIVRALRDCNALDDCTACRKIGINSDCATLELLAADRLESQQREIEAYKKAFELLISTILRYMDTVNTLTSERDAEKARADAAVKDIRKQCETCLYGQHKDVRCDIGANGKCYFGGYDYWGWRGQPQDGEEK